jgi:cyclophilin family peptidyl-prolyl cis-trans isomerase
LGGSIYGRTFADENYAIQHNRPGLLTTANPKVNNNDAGFIITLGPAEWLDRKSVAFGEVIYGLNHIRAIE